MREGNNKDRWEREGRIYDEGERSLIRKGAGGKENLMVSAEGGK